LKQESGIKNLLRRSKLRKDAVESGIIGRMSAAFNDDLDTPKALAILWEVVKSNASPPEQSQAFANADRVLGLGITAFLGKPVRVPAAVRRIVTDREDARSRKDWARADVLRAQIEALGWSVEDVKAGPALREVRSNK
jgi:cysteinyl-tRNA synthetase